MYLVKKQFGQTLVELLIAIGLTAILIPALLGAFAIARGGRAQLQQRTQALEYLQEAQEAVRIIDNNNWTNLADGTFHPVISGTTWALAAGSESIGTYFTRQIVIGDVYRDTNGNIATSGGTLDPSTKMITVSVSWNVPFATTVSSISYLTRHKNISQIQTTVTDFSPGSLSGTAVVSTPGSTVPNDGQVQLGAGGGAGGGDWCQPAQGVLATFNLPGQGVSQNLSATSTAAQNIAYTTTGGNASGDAVDGLTVSFASPPAVLNPASNNEAKAYGIFVGNQGNYVYFNENRPPNHTVDIANSSNLTDVGYFDSGVSGTGTSIYVLNPTGFVTVGNQLVSFDVSSKTGSRPQLGSVTLAGNGKRVFVVGTNAYVATDSTTSQLQIVNVATPSAMVVTKSVNLGNNLAGVDLYVDTTQTYVYIVTTYSSGSNDFFVVNAATGGIVGSYSTNGMNPKGITVVPRNRAIIVGSGGTYLYQVFDTTFPDKAVTCGGMTPAGVTSVNAVASVMQPNGKVFSYILTNNASAEFQVVLGGPGSGQFSSSGSYTSAPLQLSAPSTFNHIYADVSQPAQTSIGIQVAVAHSVSGSCAAASYTFIGPDGTAGSFFTPVNGVISAQIPFTGSGSYVNPGDCFEYIATFSSNDSTLTPILYDMTINYSP